MAMDEQILATLQSIDRSLAGLPDYPALLEAERTDRLAGEERMQRTQRRLGRTQRAIVAVVLALCLLGWRIEVVRHDSSRESRCGIHTAVAGVVDIAGGTHTPQGQRVIARVNHDLPAHCSGD